MQATYTHFIFILAKLHTGGVAAVADAACQQRSSVFAAIAGKRSLPAHAIEKMAAFLRVESLSFGSTYIEPWLARDDADLIALEDFGVTLTVLARIQSSTEKSRGTAQKHYFVVKASGGDTERYAILRMRPSVSEAFQGRKKINRVATYVVDYRRIGLLHTLATPAFSDEPLAVFIRTLEERDSTHQIEDAQKALNLALEKAATLMAVKKDGVSQAMPALEDPTLVNELAIEVAHKIYALEILNRNLADGVGKTNVGRPVTVRIMSVSGEKIRLHPRLIETRAQHLLLFKTHHINGFPVFEIVYDGSFEDVLNVKRSAQLGSQRELQESQTDHVEILLKDLRRLNEGVPIKERLKKR